MPLAKRIIPCLDMMEGKVVKGIQFKDLQFAGDPPERAALYDRQGADEIIFLDITASSDKREILLDVVYRTAGQVFIPFTVGGGIRTVQDMRTILMAGADKVALNTAAVLNPEIIKKGAEKFGSQCIVVAIDAKRVPVSTEVIPDNKNVIQTPEGFCWWEVYTYGGRKGMNIDALAWAKKAEELGAGEILLTSMDRDGTKKGFDNELNKAASDLIKIPIIASGGVGTLEHFLDAFQKGNASAALAASIFHYNEYTCEDIKLYLKKNNVRVRS